jgi:hypothetical protein
MSEHTPGPWKVYQNKRSRGADCRRDALPIAAKRVDVATVWIDASSEGTEEQHANAQLIANAPDLLAAAEWIVRAHDEWRGTGWREQAKLEAATDDWYRAIDAARHAIRKARGQK